MISRILVVVLVGIGVMLPGLSLADEAHNEIPQAVYAAALDKAQRDHGALQSVSYQNPHGQVYYRAKIVMGDRTETVYITSDGKLLPAEPGTPTSK